MQNTLRNWNNETRSNDALSQLQETSFFSNQDWCPLCQGIVFVKKYYNIYWTIQYILIYETLWFGFVPPVSKKYTLYLINHCKSTTSTTPTTISATYGNRCPAAFAIRFLQRLLHLHPQENGGTDRPPKRSGTTGKTSICRPKEGTNHGCQ